MTKEEFEKYIKMRCAQILSDDYKAGGYTLEDLVESMYYTTMDYVCSEYPVEF